MSVPVPREDASWAMLSTGLACRWTGLAGRCGMPGCGPLRHARVPAEEVPVVFGVHGEVAAHYGLAEGQYEPHATTLDYVVAAAAG